MATRKLIDRAVKKAVGKNNMSLGEQFPVK